MRNLWPPSRIIICFLLAFVLCTATALVLVYTGRGLPLNETQIMYLLSTSAQALAAVYGLTLAGFTFLREELNRAMADDESLSTAVEFLKVRYYRLLVFITIAVAATLLLANGGIAYEGSGDRLATTIINAGVSAFVISLLAIVHFVYNVISPHRIQDASRALQREIERTPPEEDRGNLEAFLANYNQIAELLRGSAPSLEGGSNRRLSNSRLADVLFRNGRINEELFGRLRNLIAIRNSIVHGPDPVVSQRLEAESGTTLADLRQALGL